MMKGLLDGSKVLVAAEQLAEEAALSLVTWANDQDSTQRVIDLYKVLGNKIKNLQILDSAIVPIKELKEEIGDKVLLEDERQIGHEEKKRRGKIVRYLKQRLEFAMYELEDVEDEKEDADDDDELQGLNEVATHWRAEIERLKADLVLWKTRLKEIRAYLKDREQEKTDKEKKKGGGNKRNTRKYKHHRRLAKRRRRTKRRKRRRRTKRKKRRRRTKRRKRLRRTKRKKRRRRR